MTPPVPGWFAASVIGFGFVVVVARWLLVRESMTNRLVNRMLSWQTGAAAIVEWGEGTDFADLTYRVFLACGAVTVASAYGIAALLAGADPATARHRQRGYDAVAVVGAVIVVFLGQQVDPTAPGFGWKSPLLWAMFNIPVAALSINIIRATVRDLRVKTATTRERLVFSALFLVAVYCLYCAGASGVQVLAGQPSDSPSADWTLASCFSMFVITTLLAVPVVNVLLARAGWDRTGRHYRRLFPLWRDLTTAVPGVVLDQGPVRRDSESRLYRRLIEIQDALQHLKLYMPPGEEPPQSVDSYAARIAHAADNKLRGHEPVVPVSVGDRNEPIARDRATDLELMLELARVWPGARIGVPHLNGSHR
ncbi:MAB_1171c family putative transporter [Nocardia ninae]|uniref:DUF6545 domain-containing protein n=1 Tax=Nocardia ninae NBRC 108245 TaxID=1210091 RepID=A0A511M9P8_9NOCA|nr:MAB_1171c family putative transporter [Nocardia ninae]GEM37241.1 hypothetical protein NN4_17600 [Nocardia ninae NBRC 108245]